MPIDTGGQIRFMAENLLTTGLTDLTVSSINPKFPLENLTSNFRGRPMKFAGAFEVDATNNKLYFNDGSNKVATIASGSYPSRALFANAVKAALNTASTMFNVLYDDVEGTFVIYRNTGFTFRLSQTTNAIHNTMGFTGNVDLVVVDEVAADQKRYHWPFEWIKVDFGYYPAVGFFSVISDSRYQFSLSEMATVKVQANTIDDFTAPPLDRTVTITSKGIFEFFDDDDYNYRFWRITIEDNNGSSDPSIGYMYLGEFHKFGDTQDDNQKYRYNAQGAKNYYEDTSEVAISEAGQVFALEKQMQRFYTDITIQLIDPIGKDFLEDIWLRFKKIKPFFISIDPKLEISNNLQDYTFFCNFIDKPTFTHQFGNKYTTDFGVAEWL